jgi:hypothetical protein
MFDIPNRIPVTVRGYTQPPGKYLDYFAGHLNQLLVLGENESNFRAHFESIRGLAFSEEALLSAIGVSL